MNTRALLLIGAAAAATFLLTRPRSSPTSSAATVTPYQIAGPYLPVAIRSTLLPVNTAVDPRTQPPVTSTAVL